MVLVSTAWADTVETAVMPGRVIEGHAKWEEDCAKCHKRFNKAAQTHLCQDCHKEVRKDIEQKQGFHGRFKVQRECRDCHTDHKGRTENIAPINEQTFNHSETDFPLKGAHADTKKVECKACHKPKIKYRDAPSECYACHKKDDKHKGKLGPACADCHTEGSWKETTNKFDHSKTRFLLRGKHAEVKCEDCHANERYKNTPMDCYSCHKKDDYHKGVFSPKCETCHGEKDWKTSTFNHDKDTKYPLKGKHAKVKCESCHKKPVASEKTPTACIACHQKDDKHKGNFGPKCQTCHVETVWKTITFDHDRDTKYLLKGKHTTTKCESCHKGHLYKEKTPTACYACHKKDDKHKGNFGEKCEACHVEKDWKTIPFDHDRDTKYPLRGKHKTTTCESCHKAQLYKVKTPTACYACHKKDDKHKGTYGEQCESCHIEKDWKTITFDHDRDTKYRLLGKHKPLKCDSCHKGHLYKDKLKTTCYACHEKDDKHKGQEGTECEECHNEHSWKETKFDHSLTRFPLFGKHAKAECKKCHLTAAFKDAQSDCVACHVKEDVHKRRLGTECGDCHNARDWKVWDFDHDRRTRFKLDGGHKDLDCYDCHKAPMGKKVKASEVCVSCHKKDDKHEGSYGPQCERCHEASSWKTIKPGTGNLFF